MQSTHILVRKALTTLSVALLTACTLAAQTPEKNGLANNTVLIVRHAEKPKLGNGLTAEGEARAKAYAHYFEPFHDGGENIRVDALYAGSDSDNSLRPRLTLEPLRAATGLPLNISVSTKDSAGLVKLLQETRHPSHPLIAWRHGSIPALLEAFGIAPASLIPGGKWPDEVYDWVLMLKFDGNGHLASSQLIHENLSITK